MSKRKTMDKAQARERRNQLLESAANADLSLTEGVREMRAIAGMTQEEFARHRGVSARVIKALELGQGNPTVATLNRIGQFFGLEVAFVPVKRQSVAAPDVPAAHLAKDKGVSGDVESDEPIGTSALELLKETKAANAQLLGTVLQLHEALVAMNSKADFIELLGKQRKGARASAAGAAPARKKNKPSSS
jgi:transcriptional regulator with XRE-family HTH domain